MYDHEAEESVEDDIKDDYPMLEIPGIPEIPIPDVADTVPEVRAVEQKGSGVIALKKALSMLTNPGLTPPPNELEGSEEEREKAFAYERQQRLEKDVCESAIERWRTENDHLKKMGISSVLKQGSIGSLMWNWHEALVPLIKEEVRKVNEAEEKKLRSKVERQRCLYGPFLRLLPPEKIAALSILEIMTVLGTFVSNEVGSKLSTVVSALGQVIQDESTVESISNTGKHNPWERRSGSQRLRRMSKLIEKRQVHDSSTKLVDGLELLYPPEALEWSHGVKARIGAILLSHLLEVAMVEVTCKDPETGLEIKELQPAFFHQFRYKSGKRIGLVNLNQAMVGKMGKEPLHSALSKNLPMVVEPKPWTGYKEGGFLRNSLAVVRFKPSDQQVRRYAEVASHNGDMAQVFAGLDVLARTPWKINRAVFDIMLEAWNSGEGIAKIPPENPKVEYPPEPASSDDEGVRRRWFRQIKEIEDYKSGLKSQRCFQNFQLEVARAFLKETFYFPHNVDFRGRAYPMSPFFNHMGADNCRGLLAFAKGKELGRNGLKWLKIHLASLFGFDKASFEERQKFAEDHLTEIYDAASRGLKGDRWWLKAEDPWQCLAACIELRNALESPDPQQYVSHLPIHQDGTCNGLQHYAALGGDVIGAKQVNLEPGDRPSDIYTGVADMIKAEIAEEAAQGSEIARLLHGRLTRKMVKQPVMTNVYGVTYVGAIRQVRKQLDVLTDFPDNASINLGAAARYITKKIFKSLSTMFNGAHDIQFWLANCATRISDSLTPEQIDWIEKHAKGIDEPLPYVKRPVGRKVKIRRETSFRSAVIWTTPLKMPVVQPYRSSPENVVTTNLQGLSITPPNGADPVNKRQQLQAFPPNFIHSLDATHMILSALKCNEVGLTFAAVHDSFWTHAADLEVMNTILRDAFIRMHSEDIMGRLAAEFAVRYKGSMYQASVSRFSALGKKIAAYRNAMGKTNENVGRLDVKEMEVMKERRRLKLLASEDPKEREEGESMMTAGRIYAEHASEKDLAVSEDLEEMGIGHISDPRSIMLQANEQLEVRDFDNVETPEPLDMEITAVDAVRSTGPPEFADEEVAAEKMKLEKELKRRMGKNKIWVWLPLTFPPVPKKVYFCPVIPNNI